MNNLYTLETLPKEVYVVNDELQVEKVTFSHIDNGYAIYIDSHGYKADYFYKVNDTHFTPYGGLYLTYQEAVDSYIKNKESTIKRHQQEIASLENTLIGEKSDLHYFKELHKIK